MITNLITEHNLRGYGFEYIAKILIRRHHKNNFVFQLFLFDNIDEILYKYKIQCNQSQLKFIEFAKQEWNRCDLIEFQLDSQRNVTEIICYDVKTKHMNAKKDYFEVCESNHKFMSKLEKYGIRTYIISIIMFENWRFSFNIIPYNKCRIRVFSHYKKSNENTNFKQYPVIFNIANIRP